MKAKNICKPGYEQALMVLGGILILASGLYSYANAPYYQGGMSLASFAEFGLGYRMAPLGIVLGIMIIGAGLLTTSTKQVWKVMWSVTALVFSILSMFSGGGFLLGMTLGIIGSRY